MTEFHRISHPPRSHRPKLGSVAEHLREGDAGLDVLRRAAAFHAEVMTAPRREVAHHVAEVFLGHYDIDLHDRLEQVGPGLVHPVLDGHRAGYVERYLARVSGALRPAAVRDRN